MRYECVCVKVTLFSRTPLFSPKNALSYFTLNEMEERDRKTLCASVVSNEEREKESFRKFSLLMT